jgi:hypothetical protein
MTTIMNALQSTSIKYAEFVKLTMPDEVHTFCNAASPITVGGTTFQGMGSFLGISEIQRDIKASSFDLRIMLTGIDSNNIALILDSDLKGSTIEIWRGFLDDNNQIITSPTLQFFKRYQGIINNFAINEDFNESLRMRIATVVALCSSMRLVLQNRTSGMKTNSTQWQTFYPSDTSMNRVAVIASLYFDFGKPPVSGGQTTSTSDTTTTGTDESVFSETGNFNGGNGN